MGVATGAADGAFAAAHADRTCDDGHETRPHAALAELDVCLECASGLNTGCGFFNYALTQMQSAPEIGDDAQPHSAGVWHWEMLPCTCVRCEEAVAQSGALGASEQSADRRAALLDRHRVRRLDDALGVDEPPDVCARRATNAVPVLLLRCWLLRGVAARERCVPLVARYALPRLAGELRNAVTLDELLEHTFCSFDRTALWLATESGAAAWRAVVARRCDALRTEYQLECPAAVLDAPCEHLFVAAALLRVAVAYDIAHWAQLDMRARYATERSTQHCVLALQLFADTHLDLFVFCASVCAYSDRYLSVPTSATLAETEFGEALRTSESRAARGEWRRTLLPECAQLAAIERCYPHPLRCVYAGELLDMSGMFSHANIWTQTRKKAKNATVRFVHVMLSKMQNHKCQIRDHASMLSAELGRQPVLIDFVMNLLELSQLGNYEGALARPKWTARCAVRRSHHADRHELQTWCARCSPKERVPCPKCNDERASAASEAHKSHLCDLCAFIARNARTILFASKEFYVYTVRVTELFDALLSSESGWREHRALLQTALNDARRMISGVFDAPRTPGAGALAPETLRDALVWRIARAQANIERQLSLFHDCNKPSLTRLEKRFSFYEQLSKHVATVMTRVFVDDVWSGCQEPLDFLLAPLAERDTRRDTRRPLDVARLLEVPSRERFAGHFVCDRPLAHLGGGARWCDVYRAEQVVSTARFCERTYGDFHPQLLACIGGSPRAIERLNKLRYDSVERDLPHNRLLRFCEWLAHELPVDFMLVAAVVAEMHLAAAVKVHYLDNEQARLQARALRLRMRIEPWEPLPPGCDRLWFCREHGVAYCDVVEPVECERSGGGGGGGGGDATSGTVGPVGAIYSHTLKGLICSHGRWSSGAHQWRRVGMLGLPMYADNAATRARNASVRATRCSVRKCDNKLLDSRSLLGAVVRVGQQLYTLCVKCGATCLWCEACMTAHGMTCGREVSLGAANCYTGLREFVSAHSQQIRGQAPPAAAESEGNSGRRHASRRSEPSVDSHLLPLAESLEMPPLPLGERGDAFERVMTPIFDGGLEQRREQQLIAALGAADAKRLTNGERTSALARRKQSMLALLDATDGGASAAVAAVDGDKAPPKVRQHSRGRLSQKPQVEPHLRHLQRPDTHTEDEWRALSDEDKFYRSMPEGQVYWRSVCALRNSTAPDRDAELSKLHVEESKRRGRLAGSQHYENTLRRLCAATKVSEQRAALRRRVDVTHLSDAFVLRMRDLLARTGFVDVRLDIVCVDCRARCETRSQFTRVPLHNSAGTLVDAQTGAPLAQLGMVHAWLCSKCFGNCERFLRDNPVAEASALYRHLDRRRKAMFQRRINYLIKNR